MKEIAKLGLVLMVICLAAGGVLALSNNATKDIIAERQRAESAKALQEIYGEGNEYEQLKASEMEALTKEYSDVSAVHRVKRDGRPEGYAIVCTTNGFGGAMEILCCFGMDDTLRGIKILAQQETPDIGDRTTKPDFTNQFNDLPADSEIEVQAISGASISSRAVMQGVNYAREFFLNKLKAEGGL